MREMFFCVVLELLVLEGRKPLGYLHLNHCFSKCGPQTNSICVSWKLIRNENYMLDQSLGVCPGIYALRNLWVILLNTEV